MQVVAVVLDDLWALIVCSKHFIEELRLLGSRFERLDPSEAKQVGKDVRFYLLVEGRVAAQRWRQIDFEKPRLYLAVD